ncbi:MAG: hypothetical protein P1R58_05620 [bacterium]|nr:hypothetical protein [bacterium]
MPNISPTKVVLLLSRQAMHPGGAARWVRKTVEAIRWVKQQGHTLCSSVGLLTWDLITALAANNQIPLHLLVPDSALPDSENGQEWLISEYRLDSSPPTIEVIKGHDSLSANQLRDQLLIKKADLILPISVRPGGSLEKLIKSSDRPLLRSFETTYESRTEPLGYSLTVDSISHELRQFESEKPDYLIHWTRSSNGCWPGEKRADFILDIIASTSYPRSAFHTLQRIVTQHRLFASSRHMPIGSATVSFSSLLPTELIPLMRWRARYREMSFEPYGIGLDRELAHELEIREVNYDTGGDKITANRSPQWLTQSRGKKTDWRCEQEYRALGNIDLTNLPKDKLILFCRFQDQAASLNRLTGIRTIPIENR